jgi:hypothetical protein
MLGCQNVIGENPCGAGSGTYLGDQPTANSNGELTVTTSLALPSGF